MAAFTSKATGNWSASGQTTWNEVGVPGAGDTVTIQNGHIVTIDSAISTGASGATGSAAVTVNSGARLNINFTVNFAGDLVLQRNSRLDVAAGVQLLWDMPSGANYKLDYQNAGTGGAATINFNGTENSRITMKRNSGAAADYVQFNVNIFQPLTIAGTGYFGMEDCGTSSVSALTCSGSGAAHNWVIPGFRIVNCGQFTAALTSSTLTFDFDGFDVRSSKASTPVSIQITGSYSSGTRRIRKMTHYDTTFKTLSVNLRSGTFSDHRLHNCELNGTLSSTRDSSFTYGFHSIDVGGSNFFLRHYGNANHITRYNSFHRFGVDSNNAHNVEESGEGAVSQNIYQYNVFHANGLTANDDDGLIPTGNALIEYNIFTGNFGGVAPKPTTGKANVKHNTFVTLSTIGHGSWGVMFAEVTPNNTSNLEAMHDNIFAHLGAQTTGDLSCGFGIRSTALHIPAVLLTIRKNLWWYAPEATAARSFQIQNKSQSIVSYAAQSGATGSNIRVTSQTLTAATSYPTLVCSTGSPFTSVQVGDLVVSTSSTRKGTAYVSAVNSANSITVDTASANLIAGGFQSGDAIYIQQKTFASGKAFGEDTDTGASDVYTNPQFVAPTRDLASYDTSVGGPGTALNAVKELVAINGLAFDSTSRSASTTHTPVGALTHIQDGYRPTNILARSADDTTVHAWIGAMEGQVTSTSARRKKIYRFLLRRR